MSDVTIAPIDPPPSASRATDDATTPTSRSDASAAAKQATRERIENIARHVMMFVMPLIMVGMMITGYLGTMASPEARNMPIAVAGTNATAIADTITLAEGDKVDLATVASAADAKEHVIERRTSGAVVVDGTDATIYTATAAGSSQSSLVISLVMPHLVEDGLAVATEDLVPLPDADPIGLGAMFLATALAMAGYLPFSVLSSNAPRLLRFRRIVPLLAGWSAVVAALVAVVTGPILDVIASEHLPAVMAVAWLGVFAIGSVQTFLTRLFGPMAVIVGMLFLMVLGMPSSNMSMSVYTMPGFFTVLHDVLPTAAIGEAMRAILYFDGSGVWPHILVLAVGALAGLGATLLFDVLKRRKKHKLTPQMVNMPSLTGGSRPKSKFWRGLALFAFPFLMVTMMISLMLGSMSNATPRDMPVAVVAASEEQARQTADALEEQLDDMLVFTVLTDADAARDLVYEREIVGAIVLPSAEAPEFTLITSSAASNAAAQVVTSVFTGVAAAQSLPLSIDDVSALPDRDSQGVAVMYLAMGWILAGFMIILVGANAAPSSRPLRKLLPIIALYAPFMSGVIWLIAAPITGVVDGHFWQLFGLGCLTIFSVAMFATIWERLLGLMSVIPAVGILMFLGVPSSNAAFSIYMTNDLLRWLNDVLPMAAAAESARAVLYFDASGMTGHLLTLALWGIVSLLIVSVIDLIKPLRTTTALITEPHFLLHRHEEVPPAPRSDSAQPDSEKADAEPVLVN